ncbi:MAG TPA: hypothetical protein VHK90_14960, partial [Thermoanaerobaculia bacterium]|nr:hypothetical protein [Thermoanaerobaculia bacterium]
MRRLLLFLTLLIATSATAATDVVWQSSGGTLSGNWNDAARWSGGSVPDTAAENAVINAGATAPYVVALNGAMYPAGLDVNKVFVGSPNATLTISGLALRTSEPGYGLRGYGNNARVQIDGGSVTTSGMQLSHGTTTQPVQVTLTGVQLDAGTLWVSEGSRLVITGAGTGSVPGTSWILASGQLDLSGGTIALGDLKIGGSVWEQKTACRIKGAAVTAASVQMNLTGSALYTAPLLEVSSGSLTAGYAIIGAKNNNLASDAYLVRVNGGALTFTGTVSLGAGDYARATLEINGGSFRAQHLNVGSMDAQGRYLQNNGTSTITGALTLYTQTYDINGTRQFVVGRGSTLRLTGSGFAKFGSSAWLPELLSTLDLSGVIAFEPAAGVAEQQLLAFSEDRGPAASAAEGNYAVGALDLTQLIAGGRRLRVAAAGNFSAAAVYVRSLRGFPAGTTATTVANALAGTNIRIYYDPANSPNLTGTYAFGTNSQLIPLNAPVLPTITLQSLGTAVHAARIT